MNVFVVIAVLYFTGLISSLSPDSWQKLASPGLTKPCRQNPGTGRLFSVTSTQCTTSPVTFPSKSGLVGGQGQALGSVLVRTSAISKVKQDAWACCRDKLLHFLLGNQGELARKWGTQRSWALCIHHVQARCHRATLYQAQSYLNCINKIHFATINLPDTCVSTQPAWL